MQVSGFKIAVVGVLFAAVLTAIGWAGDALAQTHRGARSYQLTLSASTSTLLSSGITGDVNPAWDECVVANPSSSVVWVGNDGADAVSATTGIAICNSSSCAMQALGIPVTPSETYLFSTGTPVVQVFCGR